MERNLISLAGNKHTALRKALQHELGAFFAAVVLPLSRGFSNPEQQLKMFTIIAVVTLWGYRSGTAIMKSLKPAIVEEKSKLIAGILFIFLAIVAPKQGLDFSELCFSLATYYILISFSQKYVKVHGD
jgi:hypothetical protein